MNIDYQRNIIQTNLRLIRAFSQSKEIVQEMDKEEIKDIQDFLKFISFAQQYDSNLKYLQDIKEYITLINDRQEQQAQFIRDYSKDFNPKKCILVQVFWNFGKFQENATISWNDFWKAFSKFIQQFEGLEIIHKDFIEKNIKFIIDNDQFQTIQIHAVEKFFIEYWLNPLLRKYILNKPLEENQTAQFKQLEQVKDQECVFKIVNGLDEQNKKFKFLKQNDILKIYSNQSYLKYNDQQIPLKQGKNIILGGRQQKQSQDQNDILFPLEFKRVSRKQFQIVYNQLNQKFNLICLSSSNPTCIFVGKQQIELTEKMIIELPNSNILYVERIQIRNKKMQNQVSNQTNIMNETTNQSITLKFHTANAKETQNDEFMFNQRNLYQIQKNFYLNNVNIQEDSINQVISANVNIDDFDATLVTNFQQHNNDQYKNNNFLDSQSTQQEDILVSQIYITVLEGQQKGTKYQFSSENKDTILIGRKEGSDIKFYDNTISNYHCQIKFLQNKWFIKEMWISEQTSLSTGGTLLYLKNSEQFQQQKNSNPLELVQGLIFQVENIRFEVVSVS